MGNSGAVMLIVVAAIAIGLLFFSGPLMAAFGDLIERIIGIEDNPYPPPPPPVIDPVTGETYSFFMFQAVRVVYIGGLDSWKYPQCATKLSSFSIKDLDTSLKVTSMQAYIFFNFLTSKQVASVNFSCKSKVSLYSDFKVLLTDVGGWMPVSKVITNPQNATDTYVISSTITTLDFEKLYANWWLTIPSYYYVITCKDITATAEYLDGTTRTFTATGVQTTENQLWWKFKHSDEPGGGQYSIINTGIEWIWK